MSFRVRMELAEMMALTKTRGTRTIAIPPKTILDLREKLSLFLTAAPSERRHGRSDPDPLRGHGQRSAMS
jgi:hypothetical protein